MEDRRPEPKHPAEIQITDVVDPQDSDLQAFSHLMRSTFADPNLVLSTAQLNRMMDERHGADRRLHLLLARAGSTVLGGSLFSYVPATNCGFSEYIVLSPAARGRGLARRIFAHRLAILRAEAQDCGRPGPAGLFVEVANPGRVSAQLKDAERRLGVDTAVRWQIMHHFGFRRVEVPYSPPPGPGDLVLYLDLLFLPLDPAVAAAGRLSAQQILDTLAPIWRSWAPATYAGYLAELGRVMGDGPLTLSAMVPAPTAQT